MFKKFEEREVNASWNIVFCHSYKRVFVFTISLKLGTRKYLLFVISIYTARIFLRKYIGNVNCKIKIKRSKIWNFGNASCLATEPIC